MELPNTEEIARYVADFRDFLQEGTIPECKALIRNFVEGIEVVGDEATLTYTIPLSQSTPKTAVLMGSGAECIGGRRRRDFQCAMTLHSASRAQVARLSQRMVTPAGPIYISRRGSAH